jgi:outer membrane protein assembly factor BamA
MRWLVGCALLAACAAGPKPRVHKPGEEYLAGLRIEGNHAIASDDLVPGLALQRAADAQRGIDDYQLQLDRERIETAYHKRGFFAVQVHTRIEHQGDAATAVFTVVEGPRATTHVVFVGLPPEVPEAQARARVPLVDGAPFDYDAYEQAKDPLLLVVEDAGYAHAALEASVIADRSHAQATVEYVFDSGPRCTFGDISIEGVDGMLADSIRARLKFHPGDRYSTTAVLQTQDALYAFGRFATVRARAQREGSETAIRVRVSVTLPEQNELRTGVGGGADSLTDFVRLHVTYARARLFTPLTTFNADLRPEGVAEGLDCRIDFWNCNRYYFRGRLIGTLTQYDFLLTDLKGEAELGLDYLTLEAYQRVGGHARLGLSRPLGTRRLQLHVGWQYTYADFSEIFVSAAAAASIGIDHPDDVGAYTAALVLDLRDKQIEPTRGMYADLRVAKGTRLAGGDFDYLELIPDVRAFYSLGDTVLAARARFGTISGQVPAIERFYGGGIASHRGFALRRLSPVDPVTGIVIGGAALLETSFEVRQPIPWLFDGLFGAVVFLDGGDVTSQLSQLDVRNLNWAAGAGLRVLTPIGPLGLDFAYRLNRTGPTDPEPGERYQFILALGEAF